MGEALVTTPAAPEEVMLNTGSVPLEVVRVVVVVAAVLLFVLPVDSVLSPLTTLLDVLLSDTDGCGRGTFARAFGCRFP